MAITDVTHQHQRSNRLRVRLATEDDLVRVCEIVNYFIEKTVVNFRTEPQVVDEWRHDWRRLHSRFPWLVATTDDRLVGVAYTAPWNDRNAYRWTVEATVYVDASGHRRGVGDALYTELLSRLRRQGFRSVVAVIALPNDSSVRLHGSSRSASWSMRVSSWAAGTTSHSGSAQCAATATRYRRRGPSINGSHGDFVRHALPRQASTAAENVAWRRSGAGIPRVGISDVAREGHAQPQV